MVGFRTLVEEARGAVEAIAIVVLALVSQRHFAVEAGETAWTNAIEYVHGWQADASGAILARRTHARILELAQQARVAYLTFAVESGGACLIANALILTNACRAKISGRQRLSCQAVL